MNCAACTIVLVHTGTGAPLGRGTPSGVFALGDCLGHRRCRDTPLLCKGACTSRPRCIPRNSCCEMGAAGKDTMCHPSGRGNGCGVVQCGRSIYCARGVLFPQV